MNKFKLQRQLLIALISSSFVLLTSCAVSPEHHVRTGADPRYQDKNVAFQTTYYFRVFDYCANQHTEQSMAMPKSTGLYRFKMTGKAETWKDKIKFESGVLNSWEIDPLGANVIYDENIGRHRFVSEGETQSEANRQRAWAEYEKLKQEYEALSSQANTQATVDKVMSAMLREYISKGEYVEQDKSFDLTSLFAAGSGAINTSITARNKTLGEKISSVLKAQHQALIETNNAQMTTILTNEGMAWLRQLALEQVKSKIASEVSSNKLQAVFTVTEVKDDEWTTLVNNLKANLLDDDVQTTHIKALANKYKNLQAISDIANHQYNDKSSAEILADVFLKSVKSTSLKDATDEYAYILANTKAKLQKKDEDGEPLANEYESLSQTHIDEIKAQLLSTGERLYGLKDEFILQLNSPLNEIDFDKDHSNILAGINRQNIVQQLLSVTDSNVLAAAEEYYVNNAAQYSSMLTTLKLAMNKQLQLATGLPTTSLPKISEQIKAASSNNAIQCDMNERRGFQILGPEGWRTFNQDERLIMAMYVDNAPITQVLKQLSSQVLKSYNSNEPNLLPIVEAELRLSKATTAVIPKQSQIEASNDINEQINLLCELTKTLETQLTTEDETSSSVNCEQE